MNCLSPKTRNVGREKSHERLNGLPGSEAVSGVASF
jgi:hypothetical protein